MFVLFFAAEEVSPQSQRHIPVRGEIQYTFVEPGRRRRRRTRDVIYEAKYTVTDKASKTGAFLSKARFTVPGSKFKTLLQHTNQENPRRIQGIGGGGFRVRRRR